MIDIRKEDIPDTRLHIETPLYVVTAETECWRCQAPMTVACLVARHVAEAKGSACTLFYVHDLPDAVAAFLEKHYPSFCGQPTRQKPGEYYTSRCPQCGAVYPDFYLHCELDSPFQPESKEELRRLVIEQIPVAGSMRIAASAGIGAGGRIIRYAQRKPKGSSPQGEQRGFSQAT